MSLIAASFTKLSPRPCPECPLNFARRVGGRGNSEAELVGIAEAPGAEELRGGMPLIGPSGDLLHKVWPQGFDVDKLVLLVNAMQCRPPKASNQNKEKQYKYACTTACRDRLLEQVWEYPRKAILCMGNWAVQGLLGITDFKITQHRGEVGEITDPIRGGKVKVVFSLHPAFLLRGGGTMKNFAADVQKAVELAYGEKVAYGDAARLEIKAWVPPTYRVLEAAETVHKLCDHIQRQNREVAIAADWETTGLNRYEDTPISFGVYGDWDDNRVLIMPWRNIKHELYRRAYVRLRSLPNVRWIWQSGKFDNSFDTLHRSDIGLRNDYIKVDEDTLLLSYALNESSKAHDLEEQAKNLLGAPNYKDFWRPYLPNKRASWALIPEPALFDYQAKDCKNTLHIWRINREIVRKDPHLERLYTQTLLPMSKLCLDIELYGLYVDWDFVRVNREGTSDEDVARGLTEEKGLEMELDDLEQELSEIAGRPINPNSPGEVAELLYNQFGLRLKGRRPENTRKETLEKLPSHPAVRNIKLSRKLRKMLSTYVTAIENRAVEDVIHTSYKLHGTTTGRPSSTEPNILNIPREPRFRRMYRARPGRVLVEGDYNTAELRMLAVLSEDAFLTSVFLDDTRNLHDEVAIDRYGPDFSVDQRIRAKAINFGIPYGRKAFSIAEEFDISISEAQGMLDGWFARAPGAKKFLNWCRRAPMEGRTLVTAFGRKRRPGIVSYDRIDALQNEFANFFMQSYVNDFTIHSALRMQEDLRKEGAYLVNTIYDSNLTECSEDPVVVRRVAEILKYYMEDTPRHWVDTPITFRVDLKMGTHWGLLKELHLAQRTVLTIRREYASEVASVDVLGGKQVLEQSRTIG